MNTNNSGQPIACLSAIVKIKIYKIYYAAYFLNEHSSQGLKQQQFNNKSLSLQ